MKNMFSGCKSLTNLNFRNFNTEKVVTFEKMFYNCGALSSLNLSTFNTKQVTNMISMFEKCSNLRYINLNNFSENLILDTKNMLKGTPDNIIYCIGDENSTTSIILQLQEKECEKLDCQENWLENYQNMIKERKKDINVISDKCIVKNIEEVVDEFFFSNDFPGVSIYSYDLDSTEELKKKNVNLTFIELSPEEKTQLLRKFIVNENEPLFVFLSDSPSTDSKTATSDYDYSFVLGNGTMLNLSEIKEDLYVTVTVPIRDLDLANFEYAKIFSDSGYDIYNKTSDFYNDVCSPASNDDNDIILEDRKKDIYPNNVTLCKGNCVYKEVDLESQRIVCECNINAEKINEKIEENYFLEEEEDVSLFDYLLDNLNYKIFKCVELFNRDNLIRNPAFYGSLTVCIAVFTSSLTFILSGIANIRKSLYKKMPTKEKVKKLISEQIQKMSSKNNNNNELNRPNPPKIHKSKTYKE
jgi:surface protein